MRSREAIDWYIFRLGGIVLGLLIATSPLWLCSKRARGADTDKITICRSAKPIDREWWSWRLVDGRRCWYRGRAVKSKSELRWSVDTTQVAPTSTVVQAKAKELILPPEPEPAPYVAPLEDQLLAFTCCWPDMALLEREAVGMKSWMDLTPPQPLPPPQPQPTHYWKWFWVVVVVAGYGTWHYLWRRQHG